MLLKTLVVRSTTQKDKAARARRDTYYQVFPLRYTEICYYLLHGTDKTVVAIEGIVAHGPGGNQGKLLVF